MVKYVIIGRENMTSQQSWLLIGAVILAEVALWQYRRQFREKKNPEENGYCYFPDEPTLGYEMDYFKGLTAEVKTIEETPKGPKIVWSVIKGRRNEPLDLRNYALAAVLLWPVDLNINEVECVELAIEKQNVEITQNIRGEIDV